MHIYLSILLLSLSTMLTAMNAPKPGDQVLLQPGQELVSYMTLTERPMPDDMVVIKWGSEPGYMWGQVAQIVASNLKLIDSMDDPGKIVESYLIVHKIKPEGGKIGFRHLTPALYKLIKTSEKA